MELLTGGNLVSLMSRRGDVNNKWEFQKGLKPGKLRESVGEYTTLLLHTYSVEHEK